jgi:hypothetical protein
MMKIENIKSFCKICGSLQDNGRLSNCPFCKNKLTKVESCDQCFSEQKGSYTLKLNKDRLKNET